MKSMLYIHIPKCAGMAMREMFPLPRGVPVNATHMTLDEWREFFGKQFDSIRTITVVRHPCDRFLSAFSYLKQQTSEHPFWAHDKDERFALAQYHNVNEAALNAKHLLELPHFRPMTHWGVKDCDVVLRYENIGRAMPGLPKRNASVHKMWRNVLTPAAVESLTLAYWDDFCLIN